MAQVWIVALITEVLLLCLVLQVNGKITLTQKPSDQIKVEEGKAIPDLVWKYKSDSEDEVSLVFRLTGQAGHGYVGGKEGQDELTWYSKRVFFKDQATLYFRYPASKFDDGTYSCEFSSRDKNGKQEITSTVNIFVSETKNTAKNNSGSTAESKAKIKDFSLRTIDGVILGGMLLITCICICICLMLYLWRKSIKIGQKSKDESQETNELAVVTEQSIKENDRYETICNKIAE